MNVCHRNCEAADQYDSLGHDQFPWPSRPPRRAPRKIVTSDLYVEEVLKKMCLKKKLFVEDHEENIIFLCAFPLAKANFPTVYSIALVVHLRHLQLMHCEAP